MKALSKENIAYGKELIARLRVNQRDCLVAEPEQAFDEAYFKALEYLDGEGLELDIQGEATIRVALEGQSLKEIGYE